jgi:hypothetical protein
MTKQEFLNKWGIDEFYVMTNNDFKQTLLSNIDNIRNSRTEGEINEYVDKVKEFIIDFYAAQPKNVLTDWL